MSQSEMIDAKRDIPYLVKGYVANEKRLSELQIVIQLQDKSNYQLEGNQAEGLIRVIANYAQALDILDDYDHQRLTFPKGTFTYH